MKVNDLIPHLFRTEYRKINSVLYRRFGFEHIEIVEDIVSDTFLLASETWGQKGLPQNPTAWLYAVAKNKAKDLLKHSSVFTEKVVPDICHSNKDSYEIEIDLSDNNINDSQLQMMFAICKPGISTESQIGLALNILCGFGVEEIADAFLTNKETIYKRLQRAKEKLRQEAVSIQMPDSLEIGKRLDAVLTTLYLLFSEGYYSASKNTVLRKDLCLEAMRLNIMLVENEETNTPFTNALLALMCFHASRFEARTDQEGEMVLYEDQDVTLWNAELINKGVHYLSMASKGVTVSKYHIEAAIAYWHTRKEDTKEKWENILKLYNRLLQIEYSPIAAMNRTYALAKANGNEVAIIEAEKLGLTDNHLYHSLLAKLYWDINGEKAFSHLEQALSLAKNISDQNSIRKRMDLLLRRGLVF